MVNSFLRNDNYKGRHPSGREGSVLLASKALRSQTNFQNQNLSLSCSQNQNRAEAENLKEIAQWILEE